MALNVKRKEAPIESVTIARKDFTPAVVTRTDDGYIRVGAAKKGVDGLLFSDTAAKELAEAIQLFTK